MWFPRQNLPFSSTLINLVSNESVRWVVLLLPTLVQSTSHYVSTIFLISYHWQQGKWVTKKNNICQLVWALVILPLLLTIPVYINYSFWGCTQSRPCQEGLKREKVLRWDLIVSVCVWVCVDAFVFQITPLCTSVWSLYVDNVLHVACGHVRCLDSNWTTMSSICSKQIVGWVWKGPQFIFFGCLSVTFATCLLSSIKSAFKAKPRQSSCRSDGTHLGSLFIRPSSFQQCLVCCCDGSYAAVFTGLQGAQCAELPGHGTGAERSRLLCSDILFRGKTTLFAQSKHKC